MSTLLRRNASRRDSRLGGGRGVAASTGSLAGAVTNAVGGTAVAGGYVEILSGGSFVTGGAVDGSGNYSISGVSPGTYDARYHGPVTHSLGPSEPDTQPVTITAGNVTTQGFVAQAAIGYSDGSNLTGSAGIVSQTIPPVSNSWWKNFGVPSSIDVSQNSGSIAANLTGGPTGEPVMEYTWNSRPTCPSGPSNCSNYVYTAATIPISGNPSKLWFRLFNFLSAGWLVGGGGGAGSQCEYKFIILDFGHGGKQLEFMLENPNAGGPDGLIGCRLVQAGIDTVRTDGNGPIFDYVPATGSLRNVWDAWHLEMTGFGTTSTTTTLYHRGVSRISVTGNFLGSGNYPGSGGNCFMAIGTNINNGPDLAQTRRIREFGVYRSRPSMLNSVAV